MGQGLYRCIGWGCLNPPPEFTFDDEKFAFLFDVLKSSCEAVPDYLMLPFGVDDHLLQSWWSLGGLPKGLPHVEPRTAVTVPSCKWWPDVGKGKSGIWVSNRIVHTWNAVRTVVRGLGVELPEGEPIFVCDFH